MLSARMCVTVKVFAQCNILCLVPVDDRVGGVTTHRQSSSPSHSFHSWNTLPLNNELNLGSASGGDLGSRPQLSARLCCPYARARENLHALTHSHMLPLFPATSSCVKNAPLIGSKEEREREGKKKPETNRAGRHRKGLRRLHEVEEGGT